jgi:hypothetical protein
MPHPRFTLQSLFILTAAVSMWCLAGYLAWKEDVQDDQRIFVVVLAAILSADSVWFAIARFRDRRP